MRRHKAIYTRLEDLRRRRCLLISEVAQAIPMSKEYLSELETGQRHNPGEQISRSLENFFGCSIEDLLKDIKERTE